VDYSKDINTVEWFFGYGGNHLGLKRIIPNMRTVAICEIEAYAIENILAKMEKGYLESAPIWNDCKTFPGEPFKDRIDLFIASYPCQGNSVAGRRLGKDDPRYLWPYCLDFIRTARPGMCLFENVEGHVSLGLSTVLSDLEDAGYDSAWGIFSASEVGATHQRKRVFILGRKRGIISPLDDLDWSILKKNLNDADLYGSNQWPARPGEEQFPWEPPRTINKPQGVGERDD
jgi:DNA (cytosine-5)-methyltransferase 1